MSHKTGELMAFKLMMSASLRWKRLYNFNAVADVINGVVFKNGISSTQKKVAA